ncbi:kielin/chordin-like protein [Dendroctonus ponderosae]|uniref:VWFC domain-containing protein n=1 Tax=Dendroctonus ponderosae TaxID=77166 RepID=A0AAR5QAD3_DENPD|nr:kielin/chordin-like protein [Dendroctonus ponderosae]XP_048520118.1 kielin/chordin-like protein [Dendroctonus ponderosae]
MKSVQEYFHITVSHLLLFTTVLQICNAVLETCDQSGILLYEDMGCKPSYDRAASNSRNSCPSKYDCLGLKKSSDHCFLRGKAYMLKQRVDSKLTAGLCDLGCSCQREEDKTKFKCATVNCPEWSVLEPPTGCYRKYSLDDCCYIREMCPPYENSTTCVYDGKVYKEGENFLPKNSCWRCVCQAGFRGKLEKPFCRRRSCGVQVKHQEKLQERCAPLYYKRIYRESDPLCCPVNWICSEGNEKISGQAQSTDKMCLFGQRLIRVGQKFEKTVQMPRNMTVTCECKIPPLLTCTTYVV